MKIKVTEIKNIQALGKVSFLTLGVYSLGYTEWAKPNRRFQN